MKDINANERFLHDTEKFRNIYLNMSFFSVFAIVKFALILYKYKFWNVWNAPLNLGFVSYEIRFRLLCAQCQGTYKLETGYVFSSFLAFKCSFLQVDVVYVFVFQA